MGEPKVLNQTDFVYALAFTTTADGVAFTHHVTENMELSFWDLSNPAPMFRFQTTLNHHEYDVEDVIPLPGAPKMAMLVPSRNGRVQLRVVDETEAQAVYIDGRPLLRAAVNPSGSLAAVGTSSGEVILLALPELRFRGTAKLHDGPIQGLAFTSEDQLLSAGEDQELILSRMEVGVPPESRFPAKRLQDGTLVALAHLAGSQAIVTTFRLSQKHSFITNEALRRLGQVVTSTTPRRMLPGRDAVYEMPVFELNDVEFRYTNLGKVEANVCDTCVPPAVEMVLGTDALAGLSPTYDVLREVASFRVLDTSSGAAQIGSTGRMLDAPLVLHVEKKLRLPGHATDISVSSHVQKAVVSYSHAKPQRSPEIYEAEKAGVYPPPSPVSGALVVDLNDFESRKILVGHRGFTVTASISADGQLVATGGWDERVLVFDVASGQILFEDKLGWLVRRVRFSPDGRYLGVAAWTHPDSFRFGGPAPSMLLYPITRTPLASSK